jgi:hypothetical protein
LKTCDFGIDRRNYFESAHLLKIPNLQVELPLCARGSPATSRAISSCSSFQSLSALLGP